LSFWKEIEMEVRRKENATNDNITLQADTLTDLQVTDEQADETIGGGRTGDSDVDNADLNTWRRNFGTGL
jgi:hypothetical protein